MLRTAFLLTTIIALGCSEPSIPIPDPQPELNDVAIRLLPEQINSHVYGSFAIPFGSDGPSIIRSGAANFPGNPPGGPGTCEDGLWINSNGKRTSGDLVRPHPHCVSENSTVEVVLEPISSCYTRFLPAPGCDKGPSVTILALADPGSHRWEINQSSDPRSTSTSGTGIITGYAIDAATLGTTNRRVGYLIFDLAQFSDGSRGLFEDDCSLDHSAGIPCLNRVIEATYKPFPAEDGGVGTHTERVPGFLWFTAATRPYNY